MKRMIEKKENQVKQLKDAIAEEFENRCLIVDDCLCDRFACTTKFEEEEQVCSLDVSDPSCSCPGLKMNFEHSVVRIPEDLYYTSYYKYFQPKTASIKDMICYTQHLDPKMREIELNDTKTEFLAFGSQNGMFRIYPGRYQSKCGSYDPRTRSWFTSASTGPKDVLIILDKSASLSKYDRWEIATDAAKELIDTLTFNDFTNIVTFSTDSNILIGDTLISATSENKELLKQALDAEKLEGMTNYGKGFQTGFDLLDRSKEKRKSSFCKTIIIFLTDGRRTAGLEVPEVLDLIKTRNNVTDAVLFTYSLGDDADEETAKRIACENNGIWTHIEDQSTNLRTAMSLYYEYLALGIGLSTKETERVTWVEPYQFATSDQLGTSVSMPVFTDANPPLFVGVVVAGFSIKEMQALEPNYQKLLDALHERSYFCPRFEIDDCLIESLRAKYGSSQMCDIPQCENNISEVVPASCSVTHSSKMWCNNNLQYETDKCCDTCDIPLSAGTVATIIIVPTVIILIVIIIIVVVIVIVVILLTNKKTRNEIKVFAMDIFGK